MTWTGDGPSWLGKSFTPTLARLASKRSQQTKSTNNANEAAKPDLRGYMVFQTRETSCNQLNSSGEVLKEILTYPTFEPKRTSEEEESKENPPQHCQWP